MLLDICVEWWLSVGRGQRGGQAGKAEIQSWLVLWLNKVKSGINVFFVSRLRYVGNILLAKEAPGLGDSESSARAVWRLVGGVLGVDGVLVGWGELAEKEPPESDIPS